MEAAPRDTAPDVRLDIAREILGREASALATLAKSLGDDFLEALTCLAGCQGSVVVTGMGKAGLVGQKIAATFCSTGTPSFFLHPAEAMHGDLGRLRPEDLVLALSMSGETEELVRVVPSLVTLTSGVVAMTGERTSTLGKNSRIVIELGGLPEAGQHGLAPSTSTTAMLALGDALALTLSAQRGFRPQDFAQFHPGGSLGRKLMKVTEMMRPLAQCRLANVLCSVRETFATVHRPGRRTGAVMIVNGQRQLVGVFTDSDLARLLEVQADARLDGAVGDVMTRDPIAVHQECLMPVATQILAENHISELPVIDSEGCPIGLIDITDVITWIPERVEPTEAKTHLLPFPREAS